MTWSSFVNYCVMRQMEAEDTIQRNYDLLYYDPPATRIGGANAFYPKLALKRVGIDPKISGPAGLAEVQARLTSIGMKVPDALELLVEWYFHDRIRLGEVGYWPKRKTKPAPYLECII